MTLVDCDVMPKLQHIRIAGKVNSDKNMLRPSKLIKCVPFQKGLQKFRHTRRVHISVEIYGRLL